ncbi:MAG: heavy-metal-associated domain-containing protein, partial [Rhizobiales bacterium]|nr:heavy-metal-associated domain-containing protein [Hyphomicrobiales bacterium]
MSAVGLADRDGRDAGRTRGGLSGFVRSEGDACELHLFVDGAHCAGCIATIEGRLTRDPAVERARLNLSLRQLAIRCHGDPRAADRLAGIVEALG